MPWGKFPGTIQKGLRARQRNCQRAGEEWGVEPGTKFSPAGDATTWANGVVREGRPREYLKRRVFTAPPHKALEFLQSPTTLQILNILEPFSEWRFIMVLSMFTQKIRPVTLLVQEILESVHIKYTII